MKIFISSLVTGYQHLRDAAAEAIETLGHQVVRAEGFSAQTSTPQQACLAAVRAADVVVLLIVDRYGDVQESGLSATHEEYREARGEKPVLVFVQSDVTRDDRQGEFLEEVQAWTTGHLRDDFSDVEELRARVIRALHDHELAMSSGPVDEEEMETRARELLTPGRRGQGEAALALAVACGPYRQVIRPVELEEPKLGRDIQQQAMFGPHPVLDPEGSTSVAVNGNVLHIEQQRASVHVDESGSIRISQPARPGSPPGVSAIPSLIEEDIQARLHRALAFAAATLDRVDSVERLTHAVPAAVLTDASYMPWRTRAEHQASPNAAGIPVGGGSSEPVTLTPALQHRQALTHDTDRLAEDLTVLLRRQHTNDHSRGVHS